MSTMTREQRQQEALERWLRFRDDRSLAEACEAWDRYAGHYAMQFSRRTGADKEDCLQVARVGLIKALNRFDASRGNRFTTYATWVILGEFTAFRRECLTIIAIPEWLQALCSRVAKAGDDDPERLAQLLGVPVAHIELAQRIHITANPASLTQLGRMGREEAWDFGAEDPAIAEMEDDGGGHAAAILDRLLPLLPPRQQKALWLRIGFGMPLREAGTHLGVSYETVSKDEKRALACLQMTVARLGQEAFA